MSAAEQRLATCLNRDKHRATRRNGGVNQRRSAESPDCIIKYLTALLHKRQGDCICSLIESFVLILDQHIMGHIARFQKILFGREFRHDHDGLDENAVVRYAKEQGSPLLQPVAEATSVKSASRDAAT
jgi:hypothetical protein